jgi:methylated-DNA-[protein]-cysteine S-methyltransferase
MAGRWYTVFDTALGRCGIAWGVAGIVGVQLAEAREIETLRHLLRRFPEARETRPSLDVAYAIEAIATLARGQPCELGDVRLDTCDMSPFNRRVYDLARAIPRCETRTVAELAKSLGASGAVHAVAQVVGRNPFPMLVPCHRVLAAPGDTAGVGANAGVISRRRLLSLEGSVARTGLTLFDALLTVAPPRTAG